MGGKGEQKSSDLGRFGSGEKNLLRFLLVVGSLHSSRSFEDFEDSSRKISCCKTMTAHLCEYCKKLINDKSVISLCCFRKPSHPLGSSCMQAQSTGLGHDA